VVHGDDFVIEGSGEQLQWVRKLLEEKYIVKMRAVLGPEKDDAKIADILGRTVEWRENELWYEADPRHVEKMLESMDMRECNPCVSPGVKPTAEEDDEIELDGDGVWHYRSVVARANFLAQDRPDIRFAVKELCREMSCPNRRGLRALKRLCRYLKGVPRLVQKVLIADRGDHVVEIYVDSDFAGCQRTRRSTCGGCAMWNGICLKAWATTQTVVAMSSGEAEYYAAVKGAAEGLALQSVLSDVGVAVQVRVHSDSTACKGICNRRGIGKIRHMAVPLLWLQDKVGKGEVTLVKVPGCESPADFDDQAPRQSRS
jgi:hypothetical protein